MQTSLVRTLAAACVACSLSTTPRASDWPQFRGPTGQGTSSEDSVPTSWSEGDGVAWKVSLPGLGWSSPVVGAGRVWLTTAVVSRGAASLRLLGFDLATGRSVVDREVFSVKGARLLNAKNSFASPTPIVDADRVYVHFGADGTAALTTAGDIVWTSRFEYESQHGNGGSPALHGDLLIINCDGFDEAYVVAIDTKTGKPRWKTSRSRPWSQAYSTPLVIRVGTREELVSVGAFRTVAYDLANGRELWRVAYEDGFSNVPRPVFGHGLLFIGTGFNQPSLLAVRPGGSGDVTRTHIAWRLDRGAPLTPSPLLAGDELYIVNDGGIVTCLDARTGKTLWQHRLDGNFSASPVLAGGRIYFQSEEGVTTVIEPGRTYREVAVNVLDGAMLATMAVADRAIFIRTGTHLYRIGRASVG